MKISKLTSLESSVGHGIYENPEEFSGVNIHESRFEIDQEI